jgi:parallel beta-helix repeat protein
MRMKLGKATIMTAVLLLSMALVNLPTVKASGTIYIRPDGSIDPPTAPIQRNEDIYTLTDNINITTHYVNGIVIQRNNITLDGAGHTLQGPGDSTGIDLSGMNGVIIKNINIIHWFSAISLSNSSHNTILGNNINNSNNIHLSESSYNMILGNNITSLTYPIDVSLSNNNSIVGNNVLNTYMGIRILNNSSDNTVAGNNINGVQYSGISIWNNSNNSVIIGNNIGYSSQGISLTLTVALPSPTNNSIVGNNITNITYEGIVHAYSSNTRIVGNSIANSGYGIFFGTSSNNVIVTDNNITKNSVGIYFDPKGSGSSNITIIGNIITENGNGIGHYGSKNTIIGNNITANKYSGVFLVYSSNNTIAENNIKANLYGIDLHYSSENIVTRNNVMANKDYGIYLYYSSKNTIYNNNFIANTWQVYSSNSVNTWDNGYPSGGNYWSDYNGTDLYSGPNQDIPGSDGIGDTPYVIDAYNSDRYPLMKPWGLPPEHNMAITNITSSKTVVGQGFSSNINVTVANQGDFTETFNVTLYANTTEIETREITLASGSSTTLTFTWNTTGFAKGNYTISAYAWPVPGETDIADNMLVDGIVTVAMIGDISSPTKPGVPDGKVDMADVGAVARLFGVAYPDPKYNPNYDITGPVTGTADGKIDMMDIGTVARHFGKTDP